MTSLRTHWRDFALRSAITAAIVCGAAFVGVRLAGATPGGRTRDALTVAGTLSGPGITAGVPVAVTFTLSNTQSMLSCVRTVAVTPSPGGAFSVELPLGAIGTDPRCPDRLFDGGDVTTTVRVAGDDIVTAPINPVPYARYADQVGTPDCPPEYEREITEPADGFSADRARRLCFRRSPDGTLLDEVVRVGSGRSAFWIDRYEASVYDRTGVRYGERSSDVYPGLPKNGQWYPALNEPPLFAFSRRGQLPSATITWFQANEVCRASGKVLPTGDQWLAAASGTVDARERCYIVGTVAAPSEAAGMCVSAWGAVDMIGNVWEWTGDWSIAAGRGGFYTDPGVLAGTVRGGSPAWAGTAVSVGWPADAVLYRGDRISNVDSAAYANDGDTDTRFGAPSAIIRGGDWTMGATAGVFALSADVAPSFSSRVIGFRCVIPR